jgi:hypothetical protein
MLSGKLAALLKDPRVLLGIFVAAAITATLQKTAGGMFQSGGLSYPPFQNYVIFRNAFYRLLAGQDLYAAFPQEQADFFKYRPTFALFMAPVAVLPYTAGAIAWNVTNALALFCAVMWVPTLSARAKALTLWFVLINLMSSMQSAQSNGLMAGLMLAAFAAQERNRDGLAALLVVAAVFVKPFGGLAALPCLIRPSRFRFLAYALIWGIVFALAPLAVISLPHLVESYGSWLNLLRRDHSVKVGTSVMSWLRAWFGLVPPKNLVIAAGAVLLLLPLMRPTVRHDRSARLLLIASVLIWVVIFNYMAEPPTYVIAVLGVALWYFGQPASALNTSLLAGTFLLTCLAATDVYPRSVRGQLISPLVLRAVPCIGVWLKVQYELLTRRTEVLEPGH